MSRTSNCIKMLQMLNSGRTIKISEFADEFETNPRNIIEYRKELEDAGYTIITIPGKDGGYKLEKSSLFPSIKLKNNEKKALIESVRYFESDIEFPFKFEYLNAMNNVLSSISHDCVETNNVSFIERFPLAMSYEELSERYNIIDSSIRNNKKMSIDYLSNDNIVRTRIINPYSLFMYNNAWFVIAWCELACDYRYFKLCRIRKMNVLEKSFKRNKYYNEHDYINKFGMTKNGEWFDIKLMFTGKAAMYIKDYIYGQNQLIEECEDGTTILSVRMQYKDSIVKFVLSYGDECTVLEPNWLKEDVSTMLTKINDNYL